MKARRASTPRSAGMPLNFPDEEFARKSRSTNHRGCQQRVIKPGDTLMRYDLLSLFCGSGGLDLGFSKAGFSTSLALDKCADAVRTFNANSSREIAKLADISSLKPEVFFSLVPPDTHPIGLIGGPPCQGFSRGNVCANPTDPRNLLPYRYADLLSAANKKYQLHFFVFENVIGLTSNKHAGRLARIMRRLHDAGFNLFKEELNASDFDVPQRRRRLFIVGLNSTLYPHVKFQFPAGSGSSGKTVFDAISGFPLPRFFEKNLTADEIPFHPNHWTMRPKSEKFHSVLQTSGRSFKRLEWNAVSPTVAYGHREIHVHPDGGRRLSVFEAMIIQGFPKTYELVGTLSAQITQVSNAVPPPVAEAIANTIKALLQFPKSSSWSQSPKLETGK